MDYEAFDDRWEADRETWRDSYDSWKLASPEDYDREEREEKDPDDARDEWLESQFEDSINGGLEID